MLKDENIKPHDKYERVIASVAGCLTESAVIVCKQAAKLLKSDDAVEQIDFGKVKMREFADFIHEPMGPPPYSDGVTAACFLIFQWDIDEMRMKFDVIKEKWSSPQQLLQDVTTLSVMTDQTWGSAYKSIFEGIADD